ncbi:hypothetical protein EVAR_89929_1 [Eumeta japonica]|uniref:Reverse transcriptase domain-containing protein n=1 Tax=Eumeta variegata TaxID=151549 RepID=A0A4C1XNY8_EUMVA|nr:hypothetical protein EVAR_89929_1 [Eumeta japonica]
MHSHLYKPEHVRPNLFGVPRVTASAVKCAGVTSLQHHFYPEYPNDVNNRLVFILSINHVSLRSPFGGVALRVACLSLYVCAWRSRYGPCGVAILNTAVFPTQFSLVCHSIRPACRKVVASRCPTWWAAKAPSYYWALVRLTRWIALETAAEEGGPVLARPVDMSYAAALKMGGGVIIQTNNLDRANKIRGCPEIGKAGLKISILKQRRPLITFSDLDEDIGSEKFLEDIATQNNLKEEWSMETLKESAKLAFKTQRRGALGVSYVVECTLRLRRILLIVGGRAGSKVPTMGCPQGSVVGPALWNLLLDDLFKLPIPEKY